MYRLLRGVRSLNSKLNRLSAGRHLSTSFRHAPRKSSTQRTMWKDEYSRFEFEKGAFAQQSGTRSLASLASTEIGEKDPTWKLFRTKTLDAPYNLNAWPRLSPAEIGQYIFTRKRYERYQPVRLHCKPLVRWRIPELPTRTKENGQVVVDVGVGSALDVRAHDAPKTVSERTTRIPVHLRHWLGEPTGWQYGPVRDRDSVGDKKDEEKQPLTRELVDAQMKSQRLTKWSMSELTFLGVSSAIPMPGQRNTSSCVLRMSSGDLVLFDCGEGTQLQFVRCKSLTMNRVRVICLSHLHGDHCYGIFGGLHSMASQGVERPVLIIGPLGTHEMLNTVLCCSGGWHHFPILVLELPPYTAVDVSKILTEVIDDIQSQRVKKAKVESKEGGGAGMDVLLQSCESLSKEDHHGGASDGLDSDFLTCLQQWAELRIRAYPLKHSTMSYGYVLEESPAPGSLYGEKALAMGVRPKDLKYLKAGMPVRKNMVRKRVGQPGQDATNNNNDSNNNKDNNKNNNHSNNNSNSNNSNNNNNNNSNVEAGSSSTGEKRGRNRNEDEYVYPDQVMAPSKRGRRLAFVQDSMDSSSLLEYLDYCDVLVHEATYADDATEKAVAHRHSTASMAAEVALALRAKLLILTHFSTRYTTGGVQRALAGTRDEKNPCVEDLVDDAAGYMLRAQKKARKARNIPSPESKERSVPVPPPTTTTATTITTTTTTAPTTVYKEDVSVASQRYSTLRRAMRRSPALPKGARGRRVWWRSPEAESYLVRWCDHAGLVGAEQTEWIKSMPQWEEQRPDWSADLWAGALEKPPVVIAAHDFACVELVRRRKKRKDAKRKSNDDSKQNTQQQGSLPEIRREPGSPAVHITATADQIICPRTGRKVLVHRGNEALRSAGGFPLGDTGLVYLGADLTDPSQS